MADELFGNRRFKPAVSAKPAPQDDTDDDSGEQYRATGKRTVQVSETELLEEVDRIPSLPAVVQEIMAKVGSKKSSAQDLENLISKDMVIAGKLMKMVNSPFYGLSHPVSSISQAVNIVGFSSLKSLVLAASASNLMVADLTSYGFIPQGLWKNSISTAALARDIARRCGVNKDEAEEYFLAGLMRDVGMLVLGPIMSRYGVLLRKMIGRKDDILTRERQEIGFDHGWAGERVAEKWRLPETLTMVIGKHHRIPSNLTDAQMKQLATVRLAERLTYKVNAGVVADHPFNAQIDGILLKAVGLSAEQFQQLMIEVPGVIARADKSLE
jgi:HD-like signal output (HDOD) protein